MSLDVVHSRRPVKHGELPMRYLRVATRYLRVATILKETSHEFLRHLTSLLRHSYEYPQVPTTYIVGMSCRTRRALQLIATRATSGNKRELCFALTRECVTAFKLFQHNSWQLAREAATYNSYQVVACWGFNSCVCDRPLRII